MGVIYKGSEDQGGPFWGCRTREGGSCKFWGCKMHMVGGGGLTCVPTVRVSPTKERKQLFLRNGGPSPKPRPLDPQRGKSPSRRSASSARPYPSRLPTYPPQRLQQCRVEFEKGQQQAADDGSPTHLHCVSSRAGQPTGSPPRPRKRKRLSGPFVPHTGPRPLLPAPGRV